MAADEPRSQPDLDGRLLIEIVSWDVSLHVGLSSPETPQESRFQGGLSYVCDVNLDGRVVALQLDPALASQGEPPYG
jgi:hypothetical protein